MSNKKKEARKAAGTAQAAVAGSPGLHPHWHFFALGLLAAAVVVLWAYWPALSGPFLFDDNFLPFAVSNISAEPLSAFLHGQRPLLMATYWLSARLSPEDTWWFHFLNVLIHCVTTGLVFFIVRRLLVWAKVEESKRGLLAGIAAALFLLHPVQTEAVAYVAGRSDGLSVMLAFAAFTVFLYRRETAANWGTAAAILLLFGAALTAKESTIALPALLLLTDYWWTPGSGWEGIRRNWRVYGPMALVGAAGLAFFWKLITSASTAGFGLKDFTWYQYFFTQWRAIFVYLGLFFFPANLTLDWDFPISHTVMEHGAIVGLIVLLALAAAAWKLRARFPLASYGFFAFLILLAPTSSILPIKDPVAERRMYFAILGLLLILVDVLARLKLERKVVTAAGLAVLLLAAVVTHARAEVWSDSVALWEDTAQKSPGAWRPHFQLGFAYYSTQHCDKALAEFEKAGAIHPKDGDLLLDWALAYDCLNQPERALEKLNQSAVIQPSAHVFSQIGMEYGKLERWPDALGALGAAQRMDPNFADTYVYLGVVHTKTGQLVTAVQDFRRALELDPNNSRAKQFLQAVAGQLRSSPADKMRPLRIGVNALYLLPGGVGGTEIYLRGLLAALAELDPVNRYFVFTNRETSGLTPAHANFTAAPQPIHAASRPVRILWEQLALPLAAARLRLDVLFNPGFTAPLFAACRQVTVFHDLQHVRHPEYFRWFDLPFWRLLLFASAHVSRLLLAPSAATAGDLLRHYRLPADRVRVSPLGADAVFFDLAQRRRPEKFLLAVSTLHPHKNLDGLLRAFAEFHREQPEFRLIVCGLHGFFTGPLHDLRESLGLRDAVDFPGWIPREQLHELYAHAWAFVYPSLFEGFGIPVVEALAAGVPTACSDIEPIATIAGDAAWRFDPRDPAALLQALRAVATDEALRQRLSEAGPRRAAQFSWRKTAEITLAALTESGNA